MPLRAQEKNRLPTWVPNDERRTHEFALCLMRRCSSIVFVWDASESCQGQDVSSTARRVRYRRWSRGARRCRPCCLGADDAKCHVALRKFNPELTKIEHLQHFGDQWNAISRHLYCGTCHLIRTTSQHTHVQTNVTGIGAVRKSRLQHISYSPLLSQFTINVLD